MKMTRRKFSAGEKVTILRKHLIEKVHISEVCDQYNIKPTQFYQWQKQFFENGTAAFEKGKGNPEDKQCRNLQKKVSHLESKIACKDEVIAEIMASHVQLKKSLGEI